VEAAHFFEGNSIRNRDALSITLRNAALQSQDRTKSINIVMTINIGDIAWSIFNKLMFNIGTAIVASSEIRNIKSFIIFIIEILFIFD
jgi:hypothetical protein